jgi:hypothetical protein
MLFMSFSSLQAATLSHYEGDRGIIMVGLEACIVAEKEVNFEI